MRHVMMRKAIVAIVLCASWSLVFGNSPAHSAGDDLTTGFIEATIDGETVRCEHLLAKRNFYFAAPKVLVMEGFTAAEGGQRLFISFSGYVLDGLNLPAAAVSDRSQGLHREVVYQNHPSQETSFIFRKGEGELIIEHWDGSLIRGRFSGPLREFDAKAELDERWGDEDIPLTDGRFEIVLEIR
jgi:hypothetical protein